MGESDPSSILAVGAAAWASKDLLNRLLGPSAEFLGSEIENVVRHRVEQAKNLGRIFTIALRRIGPRANEPGVVSPRVLKRVWDDGRFCNDLLGAEYFGGLLAASRSSHDDDRALPYLRLVQDSSLYDMRLHYLLYSTLRSRFLGSENMQFGTSADRTKARVYFPASVLVPVLQLPTPETRAAAILDDATFSLAGRDLIDANWSTGSKEDLKGYGEAIVASGAVYRPSELGLKLFLWVNGHSDVSVNRFADRELKISKVDAVAIPDGAVALGLRDSGT